MPSANKRNNIALKIKRLPAQHERRFVIKTDEEKEQIKKEIDDTDLKQEIDNIKTINENKILLNRGFDKENYYFIIVFRGKVGWKSTIEIIYKLPITVMEIINEYSIKASLKKN